MQSERDNRYIDAVLTANKKVWEGLNDLLELQKQWNALDYGSTLIVAESGAKEGLLPANIGAVVFDTANAIQVVLNEGYATNMAKLL
jgi:hypothetical protein